MANEEVLGQQDFNEDILLPILKDILLGNEKKLDMVWISIENDYDILHNKNFSRIFFMHSSEVHGTVNKIRNRLKYYGAKVQAPKCLKIRKSDLKDMIKKIENKPDNSRTN